MIFRYGNYPHPANEVLLASILKAAIWNEGGFSIGYKETWGLRGFLQAPDVPSLTVAIATLKNAYSVNGYSAGLYLDDGATPTAHVLNSAASISGVKVVGGVNFDDDGHQAEYSTFRRYAITLEAEFLTAAPNDLLAFHESLSFEGTGGPRFAMVELLVEPPQKQTINRRTPCRVIQDGAAVGVKTWPTAPGPMWPDAEHVDRRRIVPKSPRRVGPKGRPSYRDFETTWHYEFEAAGVLSGNPNLWIQ